MSSRFSRLNPPLFLSQLVLPPLPPSLPTNLVGIQPPLLAYIALAFRELIGVILIINLPLFYYHRRPATFSHAVSYILVKSTHNRQNTIYFLATELYVNEVQPHLGASSPDFDR
jgi:hypothetical protein